MERLEEKDRPDYVDVERLTEIPSGALDKRIESQLRACTIDPVSGEAKRNR